MKTLLTLLIGFATLAVPFAFTVSALATNPNWDTTGSYVVAFTYEGADYPHDMNLVQDEAGNITGDGGSPAGSNTYEWVITDGVVVEDKITFSADYTATPDAVTPQTTLEVEGEIASDGTMSGTWSDNYAGGSRSGTWTTTSGEASEINTEPQDTDADADADGYVTGAEATPFYGAVVNSLTTSGDTSPNSALALDRFPVADGNGDYTYIRTFTLSDEITDLTNAHIVIHGADINGNGVYDGERESTIADGVPFEATIPVACGMIVNAGTNEYAADLNQLNSTGVSGTATMVRNGNEVTVTMYVENTSPNVAHAQHFHLVDSGSGVCPKNTVGVTQYSDNESPTVTVTIEKFVQGTMATPESANNADFPMTSTWDAENIGAGTGSYVLSETNTVAYQAVTVEMTKGADYETKELVNGDVVGAQCATGKPFALKGYTSGHTRAAAMAATPSMAKPEFTNLQHDKYVIVWNTDCALPECQIGGDVVGNDGVLEVTSIELVDTSASANGSFADGWEYVFHITAPTSEPNLAMKFSDWLRTGGSGTIPVANNMRISSLQADNGGATILLTGANVYSTPDLHMTGDLDAGTIGRQVEITVEVSVPVGTPNGAYTTAYGVQSN